MGDKLAWVPFYTDDFAGSRDVRNMSRTEVGAYIDVLCILWGSGGYALDTAGQAMTVEALAHEICRKGEPMADVLTAVQSLLAKGALKQDAKGIYNPKAVEVCKRKEEKSEKASESANRRWRRDANDMRTECDRNANACETHMPTGCDGDATHSSELIAQNSELRTHTTTTTTGARTREDNPDWEEHRQMLKRTLTPVPTPERKQAPEPGPGDVWDDPENMRMLVEYIRTVPQWRDNPKTGFAVATPFIRKNLQAILDGTLDGLSRPFRDILTDHLTKLRKQQAELRARAGEYDPASTEGKRWDSRARALGHEVERIETLKTQLEEER